MENADTISFSKQVIFCRTEKLSGFNIYADIIECYKCIEDNSLFSVNMFCVTYTSGRCNRQSEFTLLHFMIFH